MSEVGLNQLLEAGVHFGHQTRRWNPKMRKYIFTERNGIHIIDLRKTLDRLIAAQEAVRQVVRGGERVLFVCTKDQLREIIESEAERCGAFYVTERWLGGMLTNFRTIKNQIRRLKEIERGQEENAFDFYTKKERLLLDRERQKLEKYLSGVKEMSRLPGALFVVDAKREVIAVKEANRLGIPVFAITDTNADPDRIDFPIPGNDDAIRSVSLITKAIAQTVDDARKEVPTDDEAMLADLEATTYSTETGETEVEERPKRRKKRRKRIPRPDVIQKRRKAGDDDESADDILDEAEEAADGAEAGAEAEDEAEDVAPTADAADEVEATVETEADEEAEEDGAQGEEAEDEEEKED